MTFEEIEAVYSIMKELKRQTLLGDFRFIVYSGEKDIGTIKSQDGYVYFVPRR